MAVTQQVEMAAVHLPDRVVRRRDSAEEAVQGADLPLQVEKCSERIFTIYLLPGNPSPTVPWMLQFGGLVDPLYYLR